MSEQMRSEFEEYLKQVPCWSNDCEQNDEIAFCLWQAAIASVVIKLPKSFCAEIYDVYEVSDIKDALDAAGARYE